jgi:hypothetical protein
MDPLNNTTSSDDSILKMKAAEEALQEKQKVTMCIFT